MNRKEFNPRLYNMIYNWGWCGAVVNAQGWKPEELSFSIYFRAGLKLLCVHK